MSVGLWKPLAAGLALGGLIVYGLTLTGLVGPDEPRYAAVGKAMAETGDWITPRLWGEPWFEKPPLVYWLVGLGTLAGLGPELAARLPVALVSLGFLGFFYLMLRAEFGPKTAGLATILLGTSPGWVAFSMVATPDLPMTAAFSGTMLLGLRWRRTGERKLPVVAAGLLGVAVLAKGLVPLVLCAPLAYLVGRRWREWAAPLPLLAFGAVAAPWYAACLVRHGWAFVGEFFGRHHFERFMGGDTLHPQPFWFYVPVIAAAVFPWTPLMLRLFTRRAYGDPRSRFLALWVVFGLLFFSASTGKLPGYLLPLLPALAGLMAIGVEQSRDLRWLLASCAALLAVVPFAAALLPQGLAVGLSRSRMPDWNWAATWACLTIAACVWDLERRRKRKAAIGLTAASVAGGILYLKAFALPQVDRLATARPVWMEAQTNRGMVCVGELPRGLRYSLNYYAGMPVPDCAAESRPLRIERRSGRPALIVDNKP